MFWTAMRGNPEPTREAAARSATCTPAEAMQVQVRERACLRASHYRLSAEDAEDVAGEACLRMLRLLGSPQMTRIRYADRYLNRIVDNLCKAQIWSRRPVWARLKAEIVETLRGRRAARGFALWTVNGTEMAGYAAWAGRDVTCTPAYLRLLQVERPPVTRRDGKRRDLPQVLAGLFDWTGTPLPLNEVAAVAFEMAGLVEHRPEEGDLFERDLPARSDVETETLRALLVKDIAHALLSLPSDEATAFVFHLPGEVAERLCLALCPDGCGGGAAGVARLAKCLDVCPDELEGALYTLPWSDLRIAAFLCLEGRTDKATQQGIINRRQRALRRLRRVLEDVEDGNDER